jgi:hypothetical protein
MRLPRGICLQCGCPDEDGLCPTCTTLRELEGDAAIATCLSMSRNRLEYVREQLENALAAARDGVVTLDLRRAVNLHRLLAEAEFEAEARDEANALAQGIDV